MGQPVQERRRHLLVYKHRRPLSEAEVSSNDDAGALVEFADQVEQQSATDLTDRQVAQFIQDHKIGVDQPVGQPALLPGLLLLLQCIDQFDSG